MINSSLSAPEVPQPEMEVGVGEGESITLKIRSVFNALKIFFLFSLEG